MGEISIPNWFQKINSLPPPHQFLLITIIFIGGIFLSSFLNFPTAVLIGLLLLLLSSIFGLSAVLAGRPATFFVYPLIFIFGFSYLQLYNFYQENHSSNYLNGTEQSQVAAVINDLPAYSNNSVSFQVKLLPPFQGKVLIKSRSYTTDFQYGDKIVFSGKFEQPQTYEDFDYRAYLAKDNVYSVVYYPEIEILEHHQGLWLKEKLYQLRLSFQKQIDKIFTEPEGGFLSGLLLGEKRTLDKDLQLALQRSGTTHLIALSGYNITIITEAVSFLLISLGVARPQAFWAIVIFLILFIILTGASPSVVRAGIMGTLLVLSHKLGKRYEVRNALFCAALLMIIFNPKILRFDFGFQLSFAATLGLIYLMPFFSRLLKADQQNFFNWREILATTLSAQIMVLPLLILRFGSLPLISPLVNMIIISLIPATMLLGFVATSLSFISLWLGYLIGFIAYLLLHFEIGVINFFGHWNLAALNLGAYREIIFWISAILIFGFSIYLRKHELLRQEI